MTPMNTQETLKCFHELKKWRDATTALELDLWVETIELERI